MLYNTEFKYGHLLKSLNLHLCACVFILFPAKIQTEVRFLFSGYQAQFIINDGIIMIE